MHCFSNQHSLTLSKTQTHFMFTSKVHWLANFGKDMHIPWFPLLCHKGDVHIVVINHYIMAMDFGHHYEVVRRQQFYGILPGEPQPCAEQTLDLWGRRRGNQAGR